LDPLVNLKLQQAYPLALSRVQGVATCRALFDGLVADGVEKLTTTIYYAATRRLERSSCRSGSAALTIVGSPQTRLCQSFSRLSTDWAAMLLIHEALHFAGMGEKPLEPSGMTSREINLLVRRGCDL
jgi:hypothetical protein